MRRRPVPVGHGHGRARNGSPACHGYGRSDGGTDTGAGGGRVTFRSRSPREVHDAQARRGNLQLAQDILQKKGSYLLDQEDALGLDRVQVLDSNWQVCKQSPKAGQKVTVDAMVTLSSVKLTEDCP